MRNLPSERSHSSGNGFEPIAQVDADDHDGDWVERHRLSGRERFRGTVQQILRQTLAPHNANLLSTQSSPALSDSTLTDEDYLSLPIQQFDEVDLVDDHGRYAEIVGNYGPEVVVTNAALSPSFSTKAGKGIEVHVENYPLALSPGGLYVDDRLQDFSYHGSEGIISKPLTNSSSLYNYRPAPLRWRFIVVLFGGLVIFLALSQLALRLLPYASDLDQPLSVFQNITEIRRRSSLDRSAAGNKEYFIRYDNHTDTTASTRVHSTTETQDQSTSSTPSVSSISSSTPSSSTQSSLPTLTQSSTPSFSSTESETSAYSSSSIVSSSVLPSSSTESSSSTQHSATETTATTTETQNNQTAATSTQFTEVTTTSIQSDKNPSSTQQSTGIPSSNDPGPNDQSSSTQSRPGAVPTSHGQNPPEPTLSQTTSRLPDSIDPPQEPSMTTSSPGAPDEPLPQPTTSTHPQDPIGAGGPQPGDKPPSQYPSKTTMVNLPGSTESSLDPPTNEPTDQSTDQLTGQLADQSSDQSINQPADQSTDQSTDQSKDQLIDQKQSQPTEQKTEPNDGDTGSSSIATHRIPSVTTSTQTFESAASTVMTTSNVRINTSKNILAQADTPSPSVQPPDRLEQSVSVDAKPFTTITRIENMETTAPPTTSTITTSSSIGNGSFVEITMTTTLLGHIKLADPITDFTTTTTYANGTVSTISEKVYDMIWTSIETDAAGRPTATKYIHILRSSEETTLRDPLGYPTATVNYYAVETTTTLYDSNHIATATKTTIIAETTELSTLYDTNGRPTKTTILLQPIVTNTKVVAVTPTAASSPGSNGQRTLKLQRLSDGIYFAGLMLPTLVAILISVPVRILNRNVTLYQGFHALASDNGASAAESLCLNTTGPSSLLYGLLSLRSRHYLLGLTSTLVVLSSLTIPFSAEMFKLILQGAQCHLDGAEQSECSVVLSVFPMPAQVLSALLILIIFGIILVALLLRRWRTGVKHDPWSIVHMVQLAASTDMRKIMERLRRHRKAGHRVITKELVNTLKAKIFCLREWEDEKGVARHGVLMLTQQLDDPVEELVKKPGRSVAFADTEEIPRRGHLHCPRGETIPFFMLSWTGRILFLLLLSGVLIAVLTYDIVARGSEYQRGLTGKTVGVRFLFSGTGVLVTFAWGSFFNAIAFLSPYKLLKRRRLHKGQAINMNPATNPFTGLWIAFIPSRRDLYLGVVATTTILSEVLPLFLGNIPCNGVQVQSAETICVYLSVAVLSIMVLIVGWSFFIDWPSTMGADPSTIAGAMYAAHVFSVEEPLKRFFKKEAPNIV